jgi:hypothetical protein
LERSGRPLGQGGIEALPGCDGLADIFAPRLGNRERIDGDDGESSPVPPDPEDRDRHPAQPGAAAEDDGQDG